MAKRKKLPPYPEALPCVLLAVDPGASSGWAIYIRGTLWDHGLAAGRVEVYEAVQKALDLAAAEDLPVVMLGEEWGRGGRLTPQMAGGLGRAWGRYRDAAEELVGERPFGDTRTTPVRITKARVLRVHTSTWRAALGLPVAMKTERAKQAAINAVRRRFGVALPLEEHDRAEAILIGFWGTRAGRVGKALPKRVMKAAGLYREAA